MKSFLWSMYSQIHLIFVPLLAFKMERLWINRNLGMISLSVCVCEHFYFTRATENPRVYKMEPFIWWLMSWTSPYILHLLILLHQFSLIILSCHGYLFLNEEEKLQKYYLNANLIFLEAICSQCTHISWGLYQDLYLFIKFNWMDLYIINKFYVWINSRLLSYANEELNGRQCYKMYLKNAHHPSFLVWPFKLTVIGDLCHSVNTSTWNRFEKDVGNLTLGPC